MRKYRFTEPKIETRENDPSIRSNKFLTNLDKYLHKLREQNRYDPRPDITQDHYIWQALLSTAERTDHSSQKTTYNLLHYLRCGGCLLKIDRNEKSEPILKLDLDKSTELLTQYIPPEEREEEKPEPERLQMFDPPDKGNRFQNQRTREKNLAERRERQLEKARGKLVQEDIKPYINEIARVLSAMKPLLRTVEDNVGVLYFNLSSLNNYLKRREEMDNA